MTVSPEALGRTLTGDIEKASKIGALPEGGVLRFPWSPELKECYDWVGGELKDLGLDVTIDPVGNMIAIWPGGEGKAVVAASHMDSVPSGGNYDGILGVLGAVEAIRILRREDFTPKKPIWVMGFMDEEGPRFGNGLFGSRAFVGVDLSVALASEDANGITAAKAMEAWGLSADNIKDAVRVGELGAYVELHIEQGPVLDDDNLPLGAVTAIVGLYGFRITINGASNHAGTTPMDRRRDTGVVAAKITLALREEAARRPGIRATVGKIRTYPGATNIVPGRCEVMVDIRTADPDDFAAIPGWFEELVHRFAAEEGCEADCRTGYAVPPTVMDPVVVEAVRAAAQEQGIEAHDMVSGAGHDAQLVGTHVPAGMIFVPSRDGISHSPLEYTSPEDCELGARVLAGTLKRLAS